MQRPNASFKLEVMLHELSLPGVFLAKPTVHSDERGTFQEWFKASTFEEATGFPLDMQQGNLSTSRRGVVRGLHYADVPPGQAKYVTCVAGSIRDVVVDVRLGSPTFGQVGFAHGFAALSDATVMYVTTSEYDPEIERELNPCDPALAIEWGVAEPIMSDKDVAAVSLADAQSLGVLPTFEACTEYETMLRDAWVLANEEAVQ